MFISCSATVGDFGGFKYNNQSIMELVVAAEFRGQRCLQSTGPRRNEVWYAAVRGVDVGKLFEVFLMRCPYGLVRKPEKVLYRRRTSETLVNRELNLLAH